MKGCRALCLAVVLAGGLAVLPAQAQDHVTVSSCPREAKIPVVFKADCTNVKDPDAKQLCGKFLENQACKVFPAYRKITGVRLEETCPVMQYNLYEKENWPYPNSRGEGGLAGKCEITLMTDYSVKIRSKIGPYDLHELLHEYQRPIGPFINEHPLFDPAQAEAAKEIGDPDGAAAYVKRMKDTLEQDKKLLTEQKTPSEKYCAMAQTYVEESLYLEDARNVYAFYHKLGPVPANKTRPELAARENRMLYTVSYGKAKEYLVSHGCWAF